MVRHLPRSAAFRHQPGRRRLVPRPGQRPRQRPARAPRSTAGTWDDLSWAFALYVVGFLVVGVVAGGSEASDVAVANVGGVVGAVLGWGVSRLRRR